MKQGVLVYDRENDRIDIRFGLEDYYGGSALRHIFRRSDWSPVDTHPN